MRKETLVGLALIFGVAGSACMEEKKAEVAPSAVTISAEVPVLSPMAETKQAQEKGGVEISIAPAQYKAVRGTKTHRQQVNPTFTDMLLSHRQNAVMVETTQSPVLTVLPQRLEFTVKLNNKLSRVFRASGTVVQFNVAGKLAPVEQSGYADLTSAIVPPRGEQEVKVYGPSLRDIPPTSTIGFFLYDVPTKTDAAGNITEKQNFEWYFKLATQHQEESGAVQVARAWE